MFGGKVIQLCGPLPEGRELWRDRARNNYAGKDITAYIATVYFEPQLGPVFTEGDLMPAHVTFLEDMLCTGMLRGFSCIGRLK